MLNPALIPLDWLIAGVIVTALWAGIARGLKNTRRPR